ncbi:hypothetical protein LX36DRAFT_355928 [Colletotrichum falcatum]|nr:hypothetical protein LX36DRAFT_355928 [Colletotrichum falcatum]
MHMARQPDFPIRLHSHSWKLVCSVRHDIHVSLTKLPSSVVYLPRGTPPVCVVLMLACLLLHVTANSISYQAETNLATYLATLHGCHITTKAAWGAPSNA